MRSFEERKEEILRRSEKRIAQRKKTVKRVILTCVPLVLCVSAVTGYLALGGFGKMDNAAPESPMAPNYSLQDSYASNGAIADAPESAELPQAPGGMPYAAAVSVQIQTVAGEQTYTDARILDQVVALLPSEPITADSAQVPETTLAPQRAEETDIKTNGAGGNYGTKRSCVLTVTYEDGSTVTYTVTGNRISGDENSRELTQQQLAWLEDLYGEENP